MLSKTHPVTPSSEPNQPPQFELLAARASPNMFSGTETVTENRSDQHLSAAGGVMQKAGDYKKGGKGRLKLNTFTPTTQKLIGETSKNLSSLLSVLLI